MCVANVQEVTSGQLFLKYSVRLDGEADIPKPVERGICRPFLRSLVSVHERRKVEEILDDPRENLSPLPETSLAADVRCGLLALRHPLRNNREDCA